MGRPGQNNPNSLRSGPYGSRSQLRTSRSAPLLTLLALRNGNVLALATPFPSPLPLPPLVPCRLQRCSAIFRFPRRIRLLLLLRRLSRPYPPGTATLFLQASHAPDVGFRPLCLCRLHGVRVEYPA